MFNRRSFLASLFALPAVVSSGLLTKKLPSPSLPPTIKPDDNSPSSPPSIKLGGSCNVFSVQSEGAVAPGHILEITENGKVRTWMPDHTATPIGYAVRVDERTNTTTVSLL